MTTFKDIKLEVSMDNGKTWTNLASSSKPEYCWEIQKTVRKTYSIKVIKKTLQYRFKKLKSLLDRLLKEYVKVLKLKKICDYIKDKINGYSK